jgi:hypothetical protein
MIVFNNKETFRDTEYLKKTWYAMVTNNLAGRKFIERLKENNPDVSIRVRPRHSNRRALYEKLGIRYYSGVSEHTVPMAHAERFAVYAYDKNKNNLTDMYDLKFTSLQRKYNG